MIVLFAMAFGCRMPESGMRREVPEDARAAFERGLQLEGLGRPDEALSELRRATVLAPDFVDAHRVVQNVLLGRHRRGQLVEEYRAFLEEAPASAPRIYLYGRVLSDRHRQMAAFQRAARADPRLYFAQLGVGYASLDEGSAAAAADAFDRAVDLAPQRPEAFAGLLEALSRIDDPRQVGRRERVAERLLDLDPGSAGAMRVIVKRTAQEQQPSAACQVAVDFALREQSPAAFELVLRTLDEFGRPEDVTLARDRLAAPPAAPYESVERLRLLTALDERSGNPAAALHRIARAPEVLRQSEVVAALERDLLLKTGRFGEWTECMARRRLDAGFDLMDEGAERQRWERLRDALAGPEVPVGAPAAEAARALLALGQHEAAVALALAALDRDPAQREPIDVLGEALRHRRFVSELRQYFQTLYRDAGPARSFDDVMNDLRELSRECLGENVIDPVVTQDYAPIGIFLDPDPARGGGLARYFHRYGAFALVGKRTFAPCEAYVLRRIAEARIDVAGHDVYRVLGENLLVPPRAEARGAEIAGFAFASFIVLNVDRARSMAENARALHAMHADAPAELLGDPIPLIRQEIERTDTGEPLTLASRALFRSYDAFLRSGAPEERFPGLVLDSFEAHERAHILDAARFLPLYADILGKVALLVRHGLSGESIEAWLEERAQCVALANARSPMAVLAGIALMLPNRDDHPPHSVGFADLAVLMVRAIDDDPAAFPAIDRTRPILPQLDRLDDATLRTLARRLLEAWGDAATP